MNFGKQVEMSIGKSLNMAGVAMASDFSWDLHWKIDYLLRSIDGREVDGGVAVQVSLKDDPVKVKLAKLLALRRCRYFIYLLVRDPELFRTPSKDFGEQLKRLIVNLLPQLQKHQAILLEIGNKVNFAAL